MAFVLSQILALIVIMLTIAACLCAFLTYKLLKRNYLFDVAIALVLLAIIMFAKVNW